MISFRATTVWNQRLSSHLRRKLAHRPIPMRTRLVILTTCVSKRNRLKNALFLGRGRVAVSDRPNGSMQGRREGGGGAEKRATRRRRYAVRSHIGSDTSNPEATPQIPPSCWTSCSLHNRIRMNRPSPALSSPSPPPSPSFLFILFSRFSDSYSLFRPLRRLSFPSRAFFL